MDKGNLDIDPRGLIFEAYRMDIGPQECRSIFFDWAMGEAKADMTGDLHVLLEEYGDRFPDHPMTDVIKEGLERGAATQKRRGGRIGRGQA